MLDIQQHVTLTLSPLPLLFNCLLQPEIKVCLFYDFHLSRTTYGEMASTDLDTLIEMGFDKPRAELAIRKKSDCELLSVAKAMYEI